MDERVSEFKKWVTPEGDCWIWQGAKNYSHTPIWGKGFKFFGTMSARKCSLHLFKQGTSANVVYPTCENILCVHPDHQAEKEPGPKKVELPQHDPENIRKCRILFGLGFNEMDVRRTLLGITDDELGMARESATVTG